MRPIHDISETTNWALTATDCPLTPVLTLAGGWESLKELATELGVSATLQMGLSKDHTHLICEIEELSYKQRALNLFAFGAALRLKHKVDLVLWQHSTLKNTLESQIKDTSIIVEAPALKTGSGLVITPPIALYLLQAGVAMTSITVDTSVNDDEILAALTLTSGQHWKVA